MNGTTNFSSNMRENVPPAACRGDGEWEHEKQRGSYLGKGYNRKVWGGGSDCLWGGQVGERSVLVGSVQFSPSYVVLPAKSDNRNGNCDQG